MDVRFGNDCNRTIYIFYTLLYLLPVVVRFRRTGDDGDGNVRLQRLLQPFEDDVCPFFPQVGADDENLLFCFGEIAFDNNAIFSSGALYLVMRGSTGDISFTSVSETAFSKGKPKIPRNFLFSSSNVRFCASNSATRVRRSGGGMG